MRKSPHPKVVKINPEELSGLLERAKDRLMPEDYDTIRGMADTIEYIISLLDRKDVQFKRLLKQILGIKSEKSKKIFNHEKSAEAPDTPDSDTNDTGITDKPDPEKPKGHGRNGVESYPGAKHVFLAHPTLKSGDPCLESLCAGKVYGMKEPGVFTYFTSDPPIQANVLKSEKLRCNLCGTIYEAPLPEPLSAKVDGSKYYDATAKTMMVILRYGYGFPSNRLSKLQEDLGVPLPVSTIWDKIEEVANKIYRAYDELMLYAARGDIFYTDDTGMKILSVMAEIKEEVRQADGKKIRTGIFTTGIVSIVDDRKIALFFTGRKHAGENFTDLLDKREEGLCAPIHMCDAKSGNSPKEKEVIGCNCNAHARRYFADEKENFPDECAYVILDVYKEIYKNDAIARKNGMSPEERLKLHQERSGPVMEAYHAWLNECFDAKRVEPNSGLGRAISYVLDHFTELTRFLHVPGAPIDNNLCELIVKQCIRHRKNSLFYKTEHGAYIGDMFMSLIQTCVMNEVNPFDYLTELQRHSSEVFKNPSAWLPWNYREAMNAITAAKGNSQEPAAIPV